MLLPSTLGLMFANQWIGYFDESPSRPVTVRAGESVHYGNARWGVQATDRVAGTSAAGRERDLPEGTDLVTVTVSVDPTGTGPDGVPDLCTVRLEESGRQGATRSWANAAGGAITLGGAGPSLTSCSSELRTRYTFDAEFVVPADAGKGSALTVGIVVGDALPEYASIALY